MNVYGSSGVTRRGALGDLGGVAPAAALAQLVERDRVADVAGRVDDDDGLERGQPRRARLAIFATWLASSQIDEARLGVAGDPLALLGRVRRVDRHDDAAGARDRRSSAYVHSGRVVHRMARAVARLEAEVDQAAGDLRDDLADLAVRRRRPTRRRA